MFLGSSVCCMFVSYNNNAVMQDVSTVRQCGGFLARADGLGIWTQRRVVSGHLRPYAATGGFLMASQVELVEQRLNSVLQTPETLVNGV